MFSIPILDNTINPIQNLKKNKLNEFNLLYKIDLNDGLIDPIFKPTNYATGKMSSEYMLKGGLENMNNNKMRDAIFENNYDSTEEFQYTDAERLQYINKVYNNLPELNGLEQEISPYMNLPYDVKFREELINESIKNNSNVFSMTSQDFVKEYRDSVKNYNNEVNIYNPANTMADLNTSMTENNRLLNLNTELQKKEIDNNKMLREKYLKKLSTYNNM